MLVSFKLLSDNYTRVTFPDFNALAETHTRFGLPSTMIRTFCKFGFQERFDWLRACERLLPNTVLRPVIISFAMGPTSFGYMFFFKISPD